MVWEKLKEELIIPGLEAKSSDDIFEALGGKLVKQGYCKESYVQALKDREAEFPTGINTGEKGVAIPHTDVSHVNKKGIAIATLKQPVEFVEMGTDDEYVNAKSFSCWQLMRKDILNYYRQSWQSFRIRKY